MMTLQLTIGLGLKRYFIKANHDANMYQLCGIALIFQDINFLKTAVTKRGFSCQELYGNVTLNEFRCKLKKIVNKIEHDVAPTGIFMLAISCHGTDNDELLFSDDTKQKASRSVDE